MHTKRSPSRYSCPLSNEIRPPSPVIHDGSHTALEQRFEEEIRLEEERHFIFPQREEKPVHGADSSP